jgi:ribose 5-phosphate isomerase A
LKKTKSNVEENMNLKELAAARALEFVESGMVLGLGTGSTTAFFVDQLGEKLRSGALHGIVAVPTSEGTAQRARDLNIPLTTLAAHAQLDLVVDGADEVDPALDMIKGLGRALLREKVVEIHARRFVVIVDESKIVPRLGMKGPLPVEIIQFEADAHIRWLNTLGCRAEQWMEADGRPVVTDNGNFLVRCWFPEGIPDAYALAQALASRPGVVEHGLFLKMASEVIVAANEGIRILEPVK